MKGRNAQLIAGFLIVSFLVGNGGILTAIAKSKNEQTTFNKMESSNCAEGELKGTSGSLKLDKDIVCNAKWGERFGTVEYDLVSSEKVNVYVWLKRDDSYVANLGQDDSIKNHYVIDMDKYFDTSGTYTFEIWELSATGEWILHFANSTSVKYTEPNKKLSAVTSINYDVNRKLSWNTVENALFYDVDIYKKNGNEYEYIQSYMGGEKNVESYRYLYELSFGEVYVKIKAFPKDRNEYGTSESDYIQLVPNKRNSLSFTNAKWSETVPGSIECKINADKNYGVSVYLIDADTLSNAGEIFFYTKGKGSKCFNIQELFKKSGRYKFYIAVNESEESEIIYSYMCDDVFEYKKSDKSLALVSDVSWNNDMTITWNNANNAVGYMIDIYVKDNNGQYYWFYGERDVKNNFIDIADIDLDASQVYYAQITEYSKDVSRYNWVQTDFVQMSYIDNTPSTEEPETEVPKTEVPKTEVPKTEVPKTEVPKTEVPKTEVPRTEVPKTEVPRTEVPRTEVPRTQVPKTEVPKTVVPKTMVPKTEVPKTVVPKTQVPKTEVPNTIVPSIQIPKTEMPKTEAITSKPQNPGKVILTGVEFGKAVDISDYDYNSISKVIVRFKRSANNYSGAIAFEDWVESETFSNETCTNNSVTMNVSNPQSSLTVYKWWSDSDMEIESIELRY